MCECSTSDRVVEFHIGSLVGNIEPLSSASASRERADVSGVFLHPKVWKPVKLIETRRVNHDSFVFRFSLSKADEVLGLPIGQHVFIRLRKKGTGEMIQRAYTPISKEDSSGVIDVLVK